MNWPPAGVLEKNAPAENADRGDNGHQPVRETDSSALQVGQDFVMTLDDANLELGKIVEQNYDTVYCKAEADHYGMPISVHLDGNFTPEDIQRIATIALSIKP